MTTVRIYVFLTLLICVNLLHGQENPYTFTNSKAIDTLRYEKIKGDPMYFMDWTKGDIIGIFDTLYTDVLLNYNGYTKSLEVMRDPETFIELDEKYYKRIVINPEQNQGQKLVFKRGAHPRLGREFMPIVFEGKKLLLVKKFDVRMADHITQGYGETLEFKRFVKDVKYYIIKGAELRELKLSKKGILKALKEYDGIQDFMKENGLKWKNEEDLIKLMIHLESA